jgi:hypothetical protein
MSGARVSAWAPSLAVLGLACGSAGGPRGRDTVPESRDVRVADPGGPVEATAGYAYVARRPLALVALAEARGIAPDIAREAVDRLADALDTCASVGTAATDRGRSGGRTEGAARVVAPVEEDGTVGAPSVRIDPGEGVVESAIMCLVAPVRLLRFPPVDAGARGIAVEALWGRLIPAQPPAK